MPFPGVEWGSLTAAKAKTYGIASDTGGKPALTLARPRANVLRMHSRLRVLLATSSLLLLANSPTPAQLRPLEPTDFGALNGARMRVQIGGGFYFSQYASLTGTKGRLIEVGDVRTSWRSGRIMVEVAGTIQRFFREDDVIGAPADGVMASAPDGQRQDAGDYRVQTVLRLTGDTAPTAAILRFGTRLPTTDNRVGLERDQTDFFASLGAARALGPFHLMAEAGLSINGTRLSNYEQSDVLIYAATLERRGALVSAFISALGQDDLHRDAVRGNEDLGELRIGVRIGKSRWVQAVGIRGYHESSPASGFTLSAGVSFGH